MIKDITSKKEMDRLMSIKGEVRGVAFTATAKYIFEKKGKEGIKRMEEEMKNLGYPFDFNKIKPFEWVPIGLRALNFIALKRAFDWGDKELITMGEESPQLSLVLKVIMRYVISMRRLFEQTPKYWYKNYTIGKVEAYKFNAKKKYCILRIHDFKVHPAFCAFYLGYFKTMAEFGGKKNISVKETKCMYKGDSFHEFVIKWE